MNQTMKATIIKAYRQSNRDRKEFVKIVKEMTGLTDKGLQIGETSRFINDLIFMK